MLLCLPLAAQNSGYLTVGEPQKVAAKRGVVHLPEPRQVGEQVAGDPAEGVCLRQPADREFKVVAAPVPFVLPPDGR